MFAKDYPERVARGAIFLDKSKPDWYKIINASKIDLNSNLDCILGQLYGDYSYGLRKLHIKGPGHTYGFLIFRFWNKYIVEELWREEIAVRRAKDLAAKNFVKQGILEPYATYSKTRTRDEAYSDYIDPVRS